MMSHSLTMMRLTRKLKSKCSYHFEHLHVYANINFRRGMTTAELRRQIHIQSEQKRRAQIKDGFDELRKHLPGCTNKKMSKAALLTRSK